MRIVRFDEYGPADVLCLVEVETPEPGPGEIRIRAAAIGVNPADHKWRGGMFRDIHPIELPGTVGYDVAGFVDAVGRGVESFRIGDRVVALLPGRGTYAEAVIAQAAHAACVPDALELAVAAALPVAALSGVQLIEDHIRPQAGETLLLTGAVGAVGRFALYAAKAIGVRVIAAVRPAQMAEARALGADETVEFDADAEIVRIDHVADTIGGAVVAHLCKGLAPGGRIRTVATTPIGAEGLPEAPVFVTLRADGTRLGQLVEAVAAGDVPVPIARRMKLAEAAEAHRLMEAGRVGGKIILEP